MNNYCNKLRVRAAMFVLGVPLFLGTVPALGWDLDPESGVGWTCPAGSETEAKAVAQAAAFLAETLSRITGRTVSAAAGEAASAPGGIQLIVDPAEEPVTAEAVFGGSLEAYRIEPADAVLRILSPTATGVRNGVMAFLHRQGCRWLLPSPKWWILPEGRKVGFTGRETSAPDFSNRRIWYAYGAGSPAVKSVLGEHYRVWAEANRLGGVAGFSCGHSYGNIISRNREIFAAHPEYFALRPVKNAGDAAEAAAEEPASETLARAVGPQGKFCVSNPGLRELCLKDRIALLESQRRRNPYAFMVSMDPSDGDGVCLCPDCRAIGTPTDRVLSLANHVARGLREAIPGAWVGLYAYATHREPPTIDLEPNIYVQVAMAFNKTSHSYEDLIRLWGEKAGSLGIREYYGVEAWDFGLPGRMRGADPAYHRRWIPRYRAAGADSVNAESNANWGGQALGFYVAARLLWDTEAEVDTVIDDFLHAAFGSAAEPMRRLYHEFAETRRLSPGNLARMLDRAFEALDAAESPGAKARIVDVIAYLNYVVHFDAFEQCASHTEPYYEALETLMRYAHRIESRNMVHTYALARRLCNANVKGKRDELWLFGDDVLWKQGEPHTDAEILAMARDLRTELDQSLLLRETFSRDLVPVVDLPGPRPEKTRTVRFRHRVTAYLLPRETGRVRFEMSERVTAGLEDAEAREIPLEIRETPEGILAAGAELRQGTLYRLSLATGGATASLRFPEGVDVALEASEDAPLWLDMCGPFALYVPGGVKELRCAGAPRLSLLDPSGERTDISPARYGDDGFATLPASGEGRLWTVWNQTRGAIAFLNVPPLVQLDPDRALLPREVVPSANLPEGTDPGL